MKYYTTREIMFRAWDNLKKEMIAEGYHVIGEVTILESKYAAYKADALLEQLSKEK